MEEDELFQQELRVPGFDIPREGSFKKDTTGLIDINDIEGFNITISVRNKEINRDLGILEYCLCY